MIDSDAWGKDMLENRFIAEEEYNVLSLSLTKKTFIAVGFNSYIVKLKKDKEFHDLVKQQQNESK